MAETAAASLWGRLLEMLEDEYRGQILSGREVGVPALVPLEYMPEVAEIRVG